MLRRGPAMRARAELALACAGSFMVILDATIVSVALPDIRSALGFTPATLPWAVNAYTLVFAGLLLLGGRLADAYGRRATFVLGMAVFTVARLAGGLATTATLLLTARAVQGLGAALLMPVTLALVTTTFTEPDRRARALAVWSAVGAAGAALGPVLGGLLIELGGWRWVFLVTVPVGVAAIVAATILLPHRPKDGARRRLDVTGALIGTLGLSGLVYALMRAPTGGWTDAGTLTPLTGGLALLVLFVVHQARWAREPLMSPDVFRTRSVGSGNVVMFLLGLGFFASPVLLSLYLQDVHGYSPLMAGLAYLPLGLAMFAGANSAGALSVRLGVRRTTVWCCALGAAGLGGVAALAGVAGSSVLWLLLPGIVFGFGSAAAFTPVTVAATSGVPARHHGLAAGLLNTIRQVSGAIGLAILSTIAATATGGRSAGTAASGHGYVLAFAVSACCLLAAAAAAASLLPPDGHGGDPGTAP
ncbi:DHA2 family efflux MFS transporter permease subunit [Nonomuraea sp. NPDC050404]|uniref:DHA2 family efflux MFS transporter permease subunit n=1 Tax=Nonomuraea sp. NPDC050404 TaxID=3155783 RepID=UPI003400D84A